MVEFQAEIGPYALTYVVSWVAVGCYDILVCRRDWLSIRRIIGYIASRFAFAVLPGLQGCWLYLSPGERNEGSEFINNRTL